MRQRNPRPALPRPAAGLACLVGVLACASPMAEVRRLIEAEFQDLTPKEVNHRGPDVVMGDSGPARFVGALFDVFSTERAMKTVAFADRFYRTPANPGYDLVLDHIITGLEGAAFGADPRLDLKVLEQPMDHPAWSAKSGQLTLMSNGKSTVLHAFGPEDDRDRTMLPVNCPSASVEGAIALSLTDLKVGDILVTDASARQVLARARAKGAAAVISASLFPFNVDPSGEDRHLDAIQFREMPPGTSVPVCQISPRSYEAIQKAVDDGENVRLALEAEVELEQRPLRTVVAVVVGSSRPDEAVAITSHVQEPGACDNATGLAGLLESACDLSQLLRDGAMPWPDRSLVFLWGDEFRQTEMWLAATERTPVAGISSDMTGQSAATGAIALLERHPDPGAVTTLPPDEHTPWGAWEVEDEWVQPNGLSVIARCAMADVAVKAGGWTTGEHPWEGGSDHDVFIKRGVPAMLFWHFTDFTYHTSIDRMEFVDPLEMRRMGTALLATALALADPRPGDLDRYVRSLQREEQVRVDAADAVDRQDAVKAWNRWCYGARMWLRVLCLGPGAEEPVLPGEGEEK